MKISDILYKFFKIYFLMASVGIVVFFIFIWGAYYSNTNPETGENIAYVDWLPQEATDISYYKTYSNTAYEFNISESGFKKWADWDIKEISGQKSITRYYFFYKVEPYPEFTNDKTTDEYAVDLEIYNAKRTASSANGLFYSRRWRRRRNCSLRSR